MSINLSNFVNVSITKRDTSATAVAYDTAVYLIAKELNASEELVSAAPGYYTLNAAGGEGTKTSPRDPSVGNAATDGYIQTFFKNGGKYLHVITNLEFDETEGLWKYAEDNTASTAIGSATLELPADEILMFKSPTIVPGIQEDPYENVTWNTLKSGTNQKIFLNGTSTTASITGSDAISGVVYKYNNGAGTFYGVAAIAAYYTKLSLTQGNSFKDYCFTKETIYSQTGTSQEICERNSAVNACITNNLNVDALVAGGVRNIGGNDVTGEEITNVYGRIVLTQELTNSLWTLLASKIRLDNTGVGKVLSSVSNVLQNFIYLGYISLGKVWTEEDLYLDGDLVIAQNSSLVSGYAIHISPITNVQITAKTFPNIYVYYGDQTGVRKIVLTGEVF